MKETVTIYENYPNFATVGFDSDMVIIKQNIINTEIPIQCIVLHPDEAMILVEAINKVYPKGATNETN